MTIYRGEIFGLLGPNGSGKSTTIKLLLGLLFPTTGRAIVLGKDATEVKKNERIGYLPEETYLYKFLNAEETLDFYGRLFDMPATVRKQRAEALIDMVGLGWARRRQMREYSKGMARRLGVGSGADQRSGADSARRADQRLGPDRHAGNERSDFEAEGRGQDDPDVQPLAGRRAGRVRPHRDFAPGGTEGAGPRRQPAEDARRDANSRIGLSEQCQDGNSRSASSDTAGKLQSMENPDHHAGRAVPFDRARQRSPARPRAGANNRESSRCIVANTTAAQSFNPSFDPSTFVIFSTAWFWNRKFNRIPSGFRRRCGTLAKRRFS